MSEITLREFRHPEDYPAALKLWKNAGPGIHVRRSDEPEEIAKKLERDPDPFLVAEEDGQMVGTVIGGFDGRRGLIYHLAVDPTYRQRGIGAMLMDEVEKRLKAKGCIRCYLMVADDNVNAIEFYKKRGWGNMDTIFTFAKDL